MRWVRVVGESCGQHAVDDRDTKYEFGDDSIDNVTICHRRDRFG
jgi:hypothetical protein